MELSEIIVFFYIPPMSLGLNGTYLALQSSPPFFFVLDIGMGFFFQIFPALIDLHGLVFILAFFCFIFVQAFCFMFTATAVRIAIYLKRVYISFLLFCFCPDMTQFPFRVADTIMLIFADPIFHGSAVLYNWLFRSLSNTLDFFRRSNHCQRWFLLERLQKLLAVFGVPESGYYNPFGHCW